MLDKPLKIKTGTNINLAAATIFFLSVASLLIIPILPLFLTTVTKSYSSVGIVIASYYVAAIAVQYPLGLIEKKFGKKFWIESGCIIFALGALGFTFKVPFSLDIFFRALQGIGFGATTLGANAFLATNTHEFKKGPAYAKLMAAQVLGSAAGPLLAAAIGFKNTQVIFFSAVALSMTAFFFGISIRPENGQLIKQADSNVSFKQSNSIKDKNIIVVWVACLFFFASGSLTGMYDTTWSLYMISRQATNLQIGLSWVAFSVPFAAFSPVAGKLTLRHNPFHLAFLSAVVTSIFAALYPFINMPNLLIGLCALEALGAALGTPAIQSFLTTLTDIKQQTRYQSYALISLLFGTSSFAALSGYLIHFNLRTPFLIAAAVCFILSVVAFMLSTKVFQTESN